MSTYTESASLAGDWWHPHKKTKHVTIFYVDLLAHETREAEAQMWLDSKEQARWQRFRHARARYEFSLCRAALRATLCEQLSCSNEQLTFAASKYGKPYALVDGEPEGIGFNVSHSGRHGLIALALRGRVGVDVEERNMRQDLDGGIQSMLTPNERADLAAVSGKQKTHLFFLLWTMKEALLKALGTGLSLDMSKIEIPKALRQNLSAGEFYFPQLPAIRWWLESLDDPNFAAAMAHELDPVHSEEPGEVPAKE